MSYRATESSTNLSASERAAEARRILITMGLELHIGRMKQNEARFVESMLKNLNQRGTGKGFTDPVVTVRQLWWLRDLNEKYNL